MVLGFVVLLASRCRVRRHHLWFLSIIALSLISGCAPAPEDVAPTGVVSEELTLGELSRFVRGGLLFQFETFEGNDRTCGTCHRADSHFDLAPEDVEQAFAEDPEDPLFRPVDADVEGGDSYAFMREDGLVRVHVALAPNVTVDEVDGVNVQVRPDGRYVVAMRRSTPTSINSALNDHLMWDGREGTDLVHQALSAAIDHAEVDDLGRLPTDSELGDIAFFQEQLFSSLALHQYAHGGDDPVLPQVPESWTGAYADSLRHGRTFFEDTPITSFDPEHRGLCGACHTGPMLNRTGHFNPGDPPDLPFAGNRTSEFNVRNLPSYTFRVALPQDLVMPPGIPLPIPPGTVIAPAGTPITLHTPDPGALVVDTDPTDGVEAANPCISVLPCLTSVLTGSPTVVFHRIPTLWGTARTAPYFHDNSAATFEEVVDHYRQFFVPTELSLRATADQLEAAGDIATATFLRSIADALPISDQDKADIAAYMRFAFR